MKWVLRSQLKQLHRRFGFTMVYVTHDQTEALTFADKVVVMYDGEIVQIGTPAELFERPRHTFVGYFIGSPGMNVMPVDARRRQRAASAARSIALPAAPRRCVAGTIELGIRPEFVPARHARACRSPITQGRGYRPPQGRARQPRRARDRGDRRARTAAFRPMPKVRFDPGRHQHLRRFLARRDGRPRPWTRPGTTRPGSWCCRCWCWSPSRPSSR